MTADENHEEEPDVLEISSIACTYLDRAMDEYEKAGTPVHAAVLGVAVATAATAVKFATPGKEVEVLRKLSAMFSDMADSYHSDDEAPK